MTTFSNWVHNTYTRIKHLPHAHKYDLKRQDTVVRGAREVPAHRPKSPSDIRLYSLGNRTVREYSEARAAAATTTSPRTASRVMTPPAAVSNPSRSEGNRSWLHDHWKPGQVKAGVVFFERVGAASAQTTPARPSSTPTSIKVKRPAPKPPAQPTPPLVSRHGKTKRAPLPPSSVPIQTRTTTLRSPDTTRPTPQPTPQPPAQLPVQPPVRERVAAPAQAFTPPPAPSMDGLKALQRAHSTPPLSAPNMAAVFAELKGHRLVQRSDSAPETMGTARATDGGSSGQPLASADRVPLKKAPLNAFQRELKSSMRMPEKAPPIEVKPEVKRQAEALRARLEAERNAANTVSPGRSAASNPSRPDLERTYLANGRLLPTTEQKSLVDELKKVQEAHRLKT